MQLIRGLHRWPFHSANVVTIGNFDGVHRGHQAIFNKLISTGQQLDLPATVISFNPLPHEYFSAENSPPRLQRLRDKVRSIGSTGIDRLLMLSFDKALAEQSPVAFIEELLVDKLRVKHIIVGDDFRFGYRRTGNYDQLVKSGLRWGFSVSQSPTVEHKDQRISSTRIRKHLASGELDLAAELLGDHYHISGRVVQGEKIGRQLGFPTANVALGNLRPPIRGVFAVWITELDSATRYPGVANLGERPTLGGRKLLLEAHALGQQVSWYGKHLSVEFVSQIRAEQRFDSLESLKHQINKDAETAKALMMHR